MRKLVVTVTMPVTLNLEILDNESDAGILVKILQEAAKIDPRDHDGFFIQEVLDSREEYANIVNRIIDAQEYLYEEELESVKQNNYYAEELSRG